MPALRTVLAGLVGLIFGLGLIVSGMSDPAKVLAFLNLRGAWNPTLGLVMMGALAVTVPAFTWARRRARSLFGMEMQLPTTSKIDARLLTGSALFGIGWGLAGFCPGPALVALGQGLPQAALFVAAMVAGMALFEFALPWLSRRLERLSRTPPAP